MNNSKLKVIIIVLIGLIILTTGLLAVKKKLVKGSFIDVPQSAPYFWQVEAIAREGITAGYPTALGLTYRPNDQVTRAMMAVYLVRAMKLSLVNPDTPTFADVPKTASYYQYVETIAKAGITAGCNVNPTRYCPDDKVTKSQTAVFLQRAIKLQLINPATPSFQDVAKTDSFYQHVESIYQAGIIEGCLPQKYCPNEVVTRGQMAIYLVRAFKIPYGQGKIQGNVLYNTGSGTGGYESNKYSAQILDQNKNQLATSNTNGYTTKTLSARTYSLNAKYQVWKQVNNVNVTVSGPFDFRKENNNMVYNPGFETQNYGTNPFWDVTKAELGVWNLYAQIGSVGATAEAKYSGSQGLKIVDTANNGTSAAFQIIPAQPNVSYRLSAYTKKTGGQDGQMMYLRFLDANRNTILDKTATFSSTSWQKQEVTATSPANTSYIMVILYSYNTGVSTFYWDDVSLTKTDGINSSNLVFKADDIKLSPNISVQGYVVDEIGEYITGAKVTLKETDEQGKIKDGGISLDAQTDSTGYYQFSNTNKIPFNIQLKASKDTYTASEPLSKQLQAGTNWVDDLVLDSMASSVVSGKVTDSNGQPLANKIIRFGGKYDYVSEDGVYTDPTEEELQNMPDDYFAFSDSYVAVTDDQGNFDIDDLPPALYAVTVENYWWGNDTYAQMLDASPDHIDFNLSGLTPLP